MGPEQIVQVIAETSPLAQLGIWITIVAGAMAITGTSILIVKWLRRKLWGA